MCIYRITKTTTKKRVYFIDAESEEKAIAQVDDGFVRVAASDVVHVESKYHSELMKFTSNLKLVKKEELPY